MATGGTNVQYQFWSYNPNVSPAWSQLQAYSPQTTCLWTPATLGFYLLSVTAQDGDTGTEVNDTLWYGISCAHAIDGGECPAVAAHAATAQHDDHPHRVGDRRRECAVPVLGLQSGCHAGWSQLQAYSPLNSCTWTPTRRRRIRALVTAQDGIIGAEVNTMVWYTIQ